MSTELQPQPRFNEGGDIPTPEDLSPQGEYARTNNVDPAGVVADPRKAVEMAYESKPYRDGRAAIPEGERYLDKETVEELGLPTHPLVPPEWLDTDLEYEARIAEEQAARRVDRGEAALVELKDGARQMADVEDYYRKQTALVERDLEGRREGETPEMVQRRQLEASKALGSLGRINMKQQHFERKAHLPEYGRKPLITPRDTPEARKRKVNIAEEAAYAAKPGVEAAKRLNGSLSTTADKVPDAAVTVGAPLLATALFFGIGKGYAKLRELNGLRKAEKVIRSAEKNGLLDEGFTPATSLDQTEKIQPLSTTDDLQKSKPKQPPII
jgi:hypothetical protein